MITTKTLRWPRAFADLVVSAVATYSPRLTLRSRRRNAAPKPVVIVEGEKKADEVFPAPEVLLVSNVPSDWDHYKLEAFLNTPGELSELFLASDADSSALADAQTALLHTAACVPPEILDEKNDGLRLTVSLLAQTNPTTTNTLLETAAAAGHLTALRLLLSNNTYTYTPPADGTTLLHLAAAGGHLSTLTYLLDNAAADINGRTSRGWTPLHCASHTGHAAVVAELLSRGADINAADCKALTPLLLAARDGSRGVRVSDHGNVSTISQLLSNGASATDAGDTGLTALHYAARNGHSQVVRLILDSECGVDVDAKDAEGRTALFHAAKRGSEKTVEMLLAAGGDASIRNKAGWRAERIAELLGMEEVREKLVDVRGGRKRQGATRGRNFYIYI